MKRRVLSLVAVVLAASPAAYSQTAISEIPLDPNRQSVASQWVSEALFAVSDPAGQSLGPTGASRAYALLGTTMYDAWSAFEATPASTVLGDTLQQSASLNTQSNKAEAVSYAAYTLLSDIFTAPHLRQSFGNRMTGLGYNPDSPSSTSANVGVTMANALINNRRNDGSNQTNGYADTTGYTPVNSNTNVVDIERWTPENVPIDTPAGPIQSALHPQWGSVTPFALTSGAQFRPTAPKQFLLDSNDTVNMANRTITRANGSTVPISRDLIGTVINPEFINQTNDVIAHSAALSGPNGDRHKLIAEFWEDPSGTPYPPGTWMFFGQKVTESVNHDLDYDIPLFFGAGNAVMDAGIATWEAKYEYDYARPVRVIRELGELGLIGEENADGDFEIEAWGGIGQNTQTILASDFITYQAPGDNPSPPFPEFTSGHSTFSAAAATFLELLTGSDDFVLGDGTTGLSLTLSPGDSRFEPGVTPGEEVTLTWNSFSDAADEAGLSRLYGGIHFEDGDLMGRSLGVQTGQAVYNRVQYYLSGAVAVPEPTMGIPVMVAMLGLAGRRRKRR